MILSRLARGEPMHGYALLQLLQRAPGGALAPSEGTLYEALKTLDGLGLLESFWGVEEGGRRPRKYYRITEEGRRVLGELRPLAREIARILLEESETGEVAP